MVGFIVILLGSLGDLYVNRVYGFEVGRVIRSIGGPLIGRKVRRIRFLQYVLGSVASRMFRRDLYGLRDILGIYGHAFELSRPRLDYVANDIKVLDARNQSRYMSVTRYLYVDLSIRLSTCNGIYLLSRRVL